MAATEGKINLTAEDQAALLRAEQKTLLARIKRLTIEANLWRGKALKLEAEQVAQIAGNNLPLQGMDELMDEMKRIEKDYGLPSEAILDVATGVWTIPVEAH